MSKREWSYSQGLLLLSYSREKSQNDFMEISYPTNHSQPRESKLRTKDNAQAHKSSSEFEIAALL